MDQEIAWGRGGGGGERFPFHWEVNHIREENAENFYDFQGCVCNAPLCTYREKGVKNMKSWKKGI